MSMDGIIGYRHRGQGTASYAGYPINAKFPVRCCFTCLDPKLAFEILQDYITTSNMAGCSKADLYLMLTWRMEPELILKCSYPINLTGRDLEVSGHHS